MRETPRPSAPVLNENSTTTDSLLNLSTSVSSTATGESHFPLASVGQQENEITSEDGSVSTQSSSDNANSNIGTLQLPTPNGESSSPWRPGGADIYVRVYNSLNANENGTGETTTAVSVSGGEEATSGSETSQPPMMMDCDAEGVIPDVIDLTGIGSSTSLSSENPDSSTTTTNVHNTLRQRRRNDAQITDDDFYHRSYFGIGIPEPPDN